MALTMNAPHLTLRTYGGPQASHRHADHHQIVLPQAGRMEIEVDGRGGRVDLAQGVFVCAGAAHAFAAAGGHRFWVLDVPTAGTADWSVAEGAFFPIAAPLRHLLDHAATSPAIGAGLPEAVAAWSALLRLALMQPTARPPSRDAARLRQAMAHIQHHLDTPLTVAEVARAVGTSERQLHRLFQAQLQQSPRAYVMQQRLGRAVDLLRGTRLAIADIAQRCGYADQSALTHALRRAGQPTPAALRK